MEIGNNNMARFSGPLIHFYFVPPTLRLRESSMHDSGISPEQPATRPSRLMQRWTRNADGTLAACWKTT